jgi:superoxide dismutase
MSKTLFNELPDKIRTTVRNNADGHYNHSIFWPMLKKNEGGKPAGDVATAIDDSFGSYPAFQEQFCGAAASGTRPRQTRDRLDDDRSSTGEPAESKQQ